MSDNKFPDLREVMAVQPMKAPLKGEDEHQHRLDLLTAVCTETMKCYVADGIKVTPTLCDAIKEQLRDTLNTVAPLEWDINVAPHPDKPDEAVVTLTPLRQFIEIKFTV